MRIDGYTREVFENIGPQRIGMYLSSCGWERIAGTATADAFRSPRSGTVVMVPNDRDCVDYHLRVEEVIRGVSESDDVSVQSVVAGMTLSCATDAMEYCYVPENGEIGLIPADRLRDIIDAGNDINLFAYRDSLDYRPSYPSSQWEGRRDLDGIRIGPTMPGSYVVRFVYPIMDGDGAVGTDVCGGAVPDHSELSLLCDKIETSLSAVIEAAERNRTELVPG